MAKTKKKKTEASIEDGWKLFFKRKFDDAIAVFNRIIEEKNDQNALYGRACAYYRTSNHEGALTDIEALLKTDESNLDYLHTRAMIHGSNEQYEKAMKDLNKVLDIQPDNGEAWCDLGGLYLVREDFSNARDCFERAADIDKACSCAWLGKGIAALNLKEYRKANEYLNISIKLEAKLTLAYMARAEALFLNGQKKEALKDVKKALSLDQLFFEEFKKVIGDQQENSGPEDDHNDNLNEEDAIVY